MLLEKKKKITGGTFSWSAVVPVALDSVKAIIWDYTEKKIITKRKSKEAAG